MPDPDDTPGRYHFTAVSSAWTALETRVDDAPEDPNFAANLARYLTNDSVVARRQPPASPHRALTVDEARRHAEVTYFTDVHSGLKRAQKLCWYRLPDAPTAEVALSYQRLITEMTTLLAWTRWDEGRDVITQLVARAAESEARYQEEKELDRWRKRGPTEGVAKRGATLNPRTEFIAERRAGGGYVPPRVPNSGAIPPKK